MKKAVFTLGRFQGMTYGHKKLVDGTMAHAKSTGADHHIFTSQSHDSDKNPIPYDRKVGHLRKLFPKANIRHEPEVHNPFHALRKLSDEGYRHVTMVVGQDRVDSMRKQIGKYVKPRSHPDFDSNKHYDLDSFNVVSAGDRDPDAEGVEGASGTKMRQFVRSGDFASFAKNTPTKNARVARGIFNDMKKHLKEETLTEEITRKELAPMLDSFVSFASEKLGIKSLPKVRYKSDEDDYNSFAAYNPSSNELSVSTKNRHPMDVFRSVAHELVHHKQNEEGRIGKNIAKEGSTGSDIENEANSEAGKIMRWFAKSNPDFFNKSYVIESNTIGGAMAGGVRGMGYVTGEVSPTEVSQYVVDNQSHTEQLRNTIDNTIDTFYTWNDNNWWMNSDDKKSYHNKTQKTIKGIRMQSKPLTEGVNDPGKLKAIFLAGGPGSGKDFVMNSVLQGEGLKEINSDVAFEFLMKKEGLDLEMPDNERIPRDKVRGRAKNTTKERQRLAIAGRLGLIINGTADDVKKIKTVKQKLEKLGYETMMVFVNTSDEVSRQRNVERGKSGNRKVPDGTDKFGVPDNSPNIRAEKWKAAQENIGKLQTIFGENAFTVIDNTADVRKIAPEEKEKVLAQFSRVRRMAQQFVRGENKNPSADKWIKRETDKRGITDYQAPKRSAPIVQPKSVPSASAQKPDNEIMLQARRLGLSYYGFGRFGRKVGGKNKVMYKEVGGRLQRVINEQKSSMDTSFEEYMEKPSNREIGTDSLKKIYAKMTPGQEVTEDNVIPRGKYGLPQSGGLGPEYGIQVSPAIISGLAETSKSIQEWATNPKTLKKFSDKYGELAEQKLLEAAKKLEEAGCGMEMTSKKKSVKEFYDASKSGLMSGRREEIEEADDWQDVNRKDKTDGMSRAAVKKYRAENPGSKLSTAVTDDPSTLKKGGKKWNRRKSYCARSAGQMKMWPKAAKDPNSSLRKARRRWNCEE